MRRYRSILVGLDLDPDTGRITEGSRKAALQAQWLAEKTGASITLLHSTWRDTYLDQDVVRGGPGEDAVLELEATAREYDESGVPTELVYDEERPWLALIRRVLSGQADLVVVAKRNRAAEDRLGSVTRKLMRKCPAPVWAVKPGHDLVHRLVLSATDLTPVGDLAVELGAYVSSAHGCEFAVVHAWQMPFALQMESARLSESDARARRKELEDAAVDRLRRLTADLEVPHAKLHVVCDNPVHAILGEVESREPDLLVMGTVSRGGIAGFLVGNTAEKVLDRVDCSLLTVKPSDFVTPVEAEG